MTLDRSWPAEVRAEAVRLAATTDMNLADIAAQLGVPLNTVRSWVQRSAQATSADDAGELIDDDGDADPVDFSDATSASVRLTVTAEKVLRRLERMVQAGRATDAKNLTISLGILLDKSTQLVAKALEAEAARKAISERDGHLLAQVLNGALTELGLTLEQRAHVRPLIRKHIEIATRDAGRSPVELPAGSLGGDPSERAQRIREIAEELRMRRASIVIDVPEERQLDEEITELIEKIAELRPPAESFDEPEVLELPELEDVDANDQAVTVELAEELEPDLPPRPVERERHGPPRPPTVTRRYLYTPPGVDDPTRGDAA